MISIRYLPGMAQDLKIRGGVRPLLLASAIPGFRTKLISSEKFRDHSLATFFMRYTVVCIKVRTASFPRFWKNHP